VHPRQEHSRPDLQGILNTGIDKSAILRANVVNDFEEPVFKEFREISNLKDILYQKGAEFALMSGSGSSVFGFFSSEAEAKHLRSELSNTYSVSITEPPFKPELN
jgi:4-diphosphocytidyl-2-C-methyl-D-erythritol kinase